MFMYSDTHAPKLKLLCMFVRVHFGYSAAHGITPASEFTVSFICLFLKGAALY